MSLDKANFAFIKKFALSYHFIAYSRMFIEKFEKIKVEQMFFYFRKDHVLNTETQRKFLTTKIVLTFL